MRVVGVWRFPGVKTFILTTLLLGMAATTFADTKSELDNRVRKLMAGLTRFRRTPRRAFQPRNSSRRRESSSWNCTKGGLVFGYENGFGVAMIKNNGKWGAFSFMNS